jgi:glycosyltransferase involved in cell wall biosynthesis
MTRTDEAKQRPIRREGPVPLTVVIPALNEERNIGAALLSVAWADQIFVVDSGSTDGTVEIAAGADVEVVHFEFRPPGPKKKAWALRELPIRNDWVFLLDADERVTPELAEEIRGVVECGTAAGYCVDREFIFMGRSLRCFRPNWNVRLFRRGLGHIEDLGLEGVPDTGDNEIHEHVSVDGQLKFLKSELLHNDYRGITAWIDRHNRYATWEAHLYRKLRSEAIGVGPRAFFRLDPFRRKRVLRRLWVRLPGRPILRFLVWYGPRRGFLDGREGFVFCVLMAWYELLIGLRLRELR